MPSLSEGFSHMDVRCERCKTEYEFDDARITEAGVAVKCTTCAHVFKVKKKALVVTVPVKPGELEQVGATAMAPPAPPAPPVPVPSPPPDKQRDWKVRQASGNVFTFKELTTLQKWIVERKVTRDDEISLTGETWKRLGNIAELASFFQVVDEAQKAVQLQALQSQGLLGQTSPSVPVTAAPALPPANVIPEPANRMAVRTAERRHPVDLEDELTDVASGKSGGAGKWLVALLVLGLLGGGGYYGYFHYWLPKQPSATNGTLPDQADPAPVVAVAAPADAGAAAADAGNGTTSAGPSDSDAGATEVAAPAAGANDAVVPAAAEAEPSRERSSKKGGVTRGFDEWVSLGDRLRLRERYDAALEAYDKAIELKPTRAEPVAGRGMTLLDMGQRSEAEAAFGEALRLNPRYAVAVMGLAETYRQMGRNSDAIEYYKRYLDILPNGPEAPVAKAALERLKE